ncbi:hypothetical protein BKA67DRAFT_547156 [Truncatella angustata]|uniref:Uncharacterized protein n=1 Tax=Truncatella angustata TaxID=152316 RepID=A0A9P8UXG4_9PEZI|nr:uncharacterized protein BKA67DRAFT_547156 [Truncatella angustata]KAH6660178.1 hypothetical protein BKA67DRAFT_547156 [Truncatella angustata]KAH8201025.1 hypothetical protein TruAng_004798 [Truncatella angustata]
MQPLALFLSLAVIASNVVALPVAFSSDVVAIKDALDALKTENPGTTSSVEAVQANDYLSAASWAKRDDATVNGRSDVVAIKDALDALKTENPGTTSSVEAVQANDYLSAASWAKRDDATVDGFLE